MAPFFRTRCSMQNSSIDHIHDNNCLAIKIHTKKVAIAMYCNLKAAGRRAITSLALIAKSIMHQATTSTLPQSPSNLPTSISSQVWIFWRSVGIIQFVVYLRPFDPQHLQCISTMTWSNSLPNYSEIEQSAAELYSDIKIENLGAISHWILRYRK